MAGVIKTDQMRCYDEDGNRMNCAGSGQDGEMRFGVKWPAPRLEAHGDVVIDRLSGLMWTQDAGLTDFPQTWTDALDFVGRMNAGDAGGHTDWRLPNIRELESLIDFRRHTPALSEGHRFGRVPEGCWSSTTSVYEPRYAWVVYLQDGAVGVGYKRQPEFHAWAVRGGVRPHKEVRSAKD